MSTDVIFRILFTVAFATGIAIAFTHRLSAHTGEKLDRQQEGLPLLLALRLGGLVLWGSFIAYIINPNWLAWASISLPDWLRYAGAALAFSVIPLVYWATRTIGKNVTDTVVTRAEHQLVTSGPYRWVRHPLYTFGFTFFAALGLLAANALMLVGTVLALVLVTIRLPKEEAGLIERFGDDYRHYQARTGRYFPRLS